MDLSGSRDLTALARKLLDPIPAHRTLGLQVLRAAGGVGEVGAQVPAALTNAIGSLHSSGLITLVDAAGLAAIIGAVDSAEAFAGIVPVGSAAELRFLAPARGWLVARCRLDEEERGSLAALSAGEVEAARTMTETEVTDAGGAVVCRGSFDWSLRRR